MKKTIAPILLLLSLIPWGVSLVKFDLHWAMIWANEVRVWATVFCLFAAVAVILAYKYNRSAKAVNACFVVLACAITYISVHNFVVSGSSQSSKSDSADLQLLEFWTSGIWQ